MAINLYLFLRSYAQRATLLVLSCYIVVVSPVVAAQNKLVVPVYFATDRELSLNSPDLTFSDRQTSPIRLTFGQKNIVLVDPLAVTDEPERLQGLGWWNYLPNTDSTLGTRSSTTSFDDLVSNVQTQMSTPKRYLLIYLNGCCIGFDKSVEDGARLEAALGQPVLVYAWAAKSPTMEFYRENEINQHTGSKQFNDFLTALEQRIGADKIVLVAHSMGNRFVYDSLKNRFWNHGSNASYPKFLSANFACADVNVDDFASDEQGVAFNSQHTVVTKNNTDKALLSSQAQRGFYGRLGCPLNATSKLCNVGDVDLYDISNLYFTKHDFPLPVIVDLLRQQEGGYQNNFLYIQKQPHIFQVRK